MHQTPNKAWVGGWECVGGCIRLSCCETRTTWKQLHACVTAIVAPPQKSPRQHPHSKTFRRVLGLVGPTHSLPTLRGGKKIIKPARASRAQIRPQHSCAAGRIQRRATGRRREAHCCRPPVRTYACVRSAPSCEQKQQHSLTPHLPSLTLSNGRARRPGSYNAHGQH